MTTSLTEIARELYGLPPREFTAARNGRARELKGTDAALATRVAALRKPAPAAGVVNLLARQCADDLDALVRLGEQMRSAQEQLDRDALRRIGDERRTAVAALTRRGAELAAGLGYPPTANVQAEVEQTLLAGTADAAAATAVSSGLLVTALRADGFEPVDLAGAVAVPDAEPWRGPAERHRRTGTAPPSPVQLAVVRRRKEARLQADRLEREADTAAGELDALDRRARRLALRRTSLEAEVAELREQVATAEAALHGVTDDEKALSAARATAHSVAEDSSARARAARATADALETSPG
jgi:hypothetical protein